jgi:hypothetical protein
MAESFWRYECDACGETCFMISPSSERGCDGRSDEVCPGCDGVFRLQGWCEPPSLEAMLRERSDLHAQVRQAALDNILYMGQAQRALEERDHLRALYERTKPVVAAALWFTHRALLDLPPETRAAFRELTDATVALADTNSDPACGMITQAEFAEYRARLEERILEADDDHREAVEADDIWEETHAEGMLSGLRWALEETTKLVPRENAPPEKP